jgi:phosphate transport system substrate-binding protein
VAKRLRVLCAAAAVLPLALLAACSSGSSNSPTSSPGSAPGAASNGKTITETGSTLLFPLFGAWQTDYNTDFPNVTITSGATGSGTGITDAATGLVNIGASDAYLSPADLQTYPGLLNIPLAVSGAAIVYNLPGVKGHVKFNGKVLADIYAGKITKWNDPAIKAINPGMSLPSMNIVTLHRSDSSGTTFIYTSFLNAQDPKDWPIANVGTTVTWPSVPGQLGELGNGGMVAACGTTKGCIAYVGISYLSKTEALNLGTGALGNKSGNFELPETPAIKAALDQFEPKTPASGAQSLINTTAPTGYPIINYEYAIVKKQQASAAEAAAIQKFLTWIVTKGNSSTYLEPVLFEPLPARVLAISQKLISSISG